MALSGVIQFVRGVLNGADEVQHVDRRQEAIRVATAAVLLEVAHADSDVSSDEEVVILAHLNRAFGLEGDAARTLVEAARDIRDKTIDHWHLTNLIRTNTSIDERTEIVRSMWRIIFSDGFFHQYEGYLVRKLSELLGLEHHVMIEIKLEVKRDMGSGAE